MPRARIERATSGSSHRRYCLLSLRGIAWTCPDSNRGPLLCQSSALPAAPQAHESGTGESNPALPGPRPGPVTAPVVPDAGRHRAHSCPGRRNCFMPSTVEFSTHVRRRLTGARVRRGDRTRTCSLRFWRPLPYQLGHTPRKHTATRGVLTLQREEPPTRIGKAALAELTRGSAAPPTRGAQAFPGEEPMCRRIPGDSRARTGTGQRSLPVPVGLPHHLRTPCCVGVPVQ